MRRVRIINVLPEFFGQMCRSTGDDCLIISVKGVPSDAKFLAAYYNYERNVFQCKFEHESFEDVPEGCMCPEETIEQTVYRS